MLSLIVAKSTNNVIGINNKLPWHLPNDLKWFKKNTINKTVIMGKNTFLSIGKALPKRNNIVVSSTLTNTYEDILVVNTFEKAIVAANKHECEAFVIGGSSMYQKALSIVDKLYITQIYGDFTGDTFFPDFDEKEWDLHYVGKIQKFDNIRFKHTIYTKEA